MRLLLVWVVWGAASIFAQSTPDHVAVPSAPKVAADEPFQTQSFDLKYIDPDDIRKMFASRSYVMDVNREMRVLTVHGSAAFLKEAADAVKRFDVPPPAPANLQLTFYLLTTTAQIALPNELAALEKELSGVKLADSQILRVRESMAGETGNTSTAGKKPHFSRVRFQSAALYQGKRGDAVSLNGLQIWLDLPPDPGAAAENRSPNTGPPDISADIDFDPNQAALVAKSGLDKPIVVAVRATVIR